MYEFIRRGIFMSPDGDGGNGNDGGNPPAQDPEYQKYLKEMTFKKNLKAALDSDPVMSDLKDRGYVDRVLGDIPEARDNMDLLKKLAFKEMTREEKAAATPPPGDNTPPATPPKGNTDHKSSDTPGDPSSRLPDPSTLQGDDSEDKIDWRNFDYDKLDNVSPFSKLMLRMVIDPSARNRLQLKKR